MSAQTELASSGTLADGVGAAVALSPTSHLPDEVAPLVRTRCVKSFDSLPTFQRPAAIFGRQFGQVVTLSVLIRLDHNILAGFGGRSVWLSGRVGP
jgi:hypothetical protein